MQILLAIYTPQHCLYATKPMTKRHVYCHIQFYNKIRPEITFEQAHMSWFFCTECRSSALNSDEASIPEKQNRQWYAQTPFVREKWSGNMFVLLQRLLEHPKVYLTKLQLKSTYLELINCGNAYRGWARTFK